MNSATKTLYEDALRNVVLEHVGAMYPDAADDFERKRKLAAKTGVSIPGINKFFAGKELAWTEAVKLFVGVTDTPAKIFQEVDRRVAQLTVVNFVKKMSDAELMQFIQHPNNEDETIKLVRTLLAGYTLNAVPAVETVAAPIPLKARKPTVKPPAQRAPARVAKKRTVRVGDGYLPTDDLEARVVLVSKWNEATTEEKAAASRALLRFQEKLCGKLLTADIGELPHTSECSSCEVSWPDMDMINIRTGEVGTTCPSCRRAEFAFVNAAA
jgi:hypothetical protein